MKLQERDDGEWRGTGWRVDMHVITLRKTTKLKKTQDIFYEKL